MTCLQKSKRAHEQRIIRMYLYDEAEVKTANLLIINLNNLKANRYPKPKKRIIVQSHAQTQTYKA